jgi:uncharacterized protein (DUF1800 family)
MAPKDLGVEHILRRAGFGASPDDLKAVEDSSASGVLEYLLDYERQPDDVDAKMGDPAYALINAAGGFSPNLNIEHARQRWLFRMVHSKRPLQEKMALFWHNHFATAYSKIAGIVGGPLATRMMALKADELPGPQGQIELFRSMALGSFRDLLIEVAKDPAMLFWLDGRLNTRQRPQENFGREIMELFTFGIGHYNEFDVYAAARVFTGWNVRLVNRGNDALNRGNEANSYYEFIFNPNQHDTSEKTFSFPIYRSGSRTIPARAAADGMQDGIDFITALATHPETGRRLARRMWNFFVSEVVEPDDSTLHDAASAYLQSGTRIQSLVHFMLRARQFQNPGNWHTRYSWPVEYVVRAVKETGWTGFSVDTLRTPLIAMGQTLFEPPDVNGWELGTGWFTTGGMLARMNFAAMLTGNQRLNLVRDLAGSASSPESVLDFFLDRLSPAPFDQNARSELLTYLEAGGAWTGSDAQLRTKGAGLARLIVGSGEYQIV